MPYMILRTLAFVAFAFAVLHASVFAVEIHIWEGTDLNVTSGDIVMYNNNIYRATKTATITTSPDQDSTNFSNESTKMPSIESVPEKPEDFTEEERQTILNAAPEAAPDEDSSASKSGLISLNVRGKVGTVNDIRIMGFVLDGSGSAEVLLRGLGPVLSEYGVDSTKLLKDPRINLWEYKTSSNIKAGSSTQSGWSNDNHSSATTIVSAINSAVPKVNTNSKQAGLLLSLDSGFYTLHMDDATVPQGVGIGNAAVDLHSSSGPTFTHLSSRGIASTDESDIIIGGFQIGGTSPRKIYIRGRGPSLSDYDVSSYISDPSIELHKYTNDPTGNPSLDASTEITSNDDVNSSTVALISALPNSDHRWGNLQTKEAGLILDLDPGYYTVHLKCGSSDSGKNAWLGIDDITGL